MYIYIYADVYYGYVCDTYVYVKEMEESQNTLSPASLFVTKVDANTFLLISSIYAIISRFLIEILVINKRH